VVSKSARTLTGFNKGVMRFMGVAIESLLSLNALP